jgi:hypothetical protein
MRLAGLIFAAALHAQNSTSCVVTIAGGIIRCVPPPIIAPTPVTIPVSVNGNKIGDAKAINFVEYPGVKLTPVLDVSTGTVTIAISATPQPAPSIPTGEIGLITMQSGQKPDPPEAGKGRLYVDQDTKTLGCIFGDTESCLPGVQVAAPSNATAPCASGSWAVDANYFYICYLKDRWKKTALATW